VGYKILLADDSVTVQKIITLTFSDEGVDVLTVNNGDEAVSRLQYMRPALVMADVSIPGKNGYEICEYVKNHPDMKDTPVVLLVPAFEPFDEERARRIGADQHLTKPFQSIRTLITTVKTLLEGRPPKFATGSLNSPSSQLQTPEPVKAQAAFAEAAPVVPIRATQPFPDEPEEEPTPVVAEAKPAFEDVLEAPQIWRQAEETVEAPQSWPALVEAEPVAEAPSIWKNEPEPEDQIWKAEPVQEFEDVLEVETEQEIQPLTEPEPVVVAEEPVFIPAVESKPFSIVEEVIEAPSIQAFAPIAESVIEASPVVASVVETVAAAPVVQFAAKRGNTGDLDHVLDLDDVLEWPPAPQAQPLQAAAVAPSTAEATIPQTVIDEIVNRVVAQLSEKLTAQLAAQLAPEVAGLVKQQIHGEPTAAAPTAKSDSDSLLDLD
jgi:CheY-like chemotaxis protein